MIRLRELIQRRGRSLIVLASLAFVCLVLTLAHSGPGSGHMDDGGMQDGQLVLMCMAVLAVGAALIAAATGVLSARRPRAPRHLRPTGLSRAPARELLISSQPARRPGDPAGLSTLSRS